SRWNPGPTRCPRTRSSTQPSLPQPQAEPTKALDPYVFCRIQKVRVAWHKVVRGAAHARSCAASETGCCAWRFLFFPFLGFWPRGKHVCGIRVSCSLPRLTVCNSKGENRRMEDDKSLGKHFADKLDAQVSGLGPNFVEKLDMDRMEAKSEGLGPNFVE